MADLGGLGNLANEASQGLSTAKNLASEAQGLASQAEGLVQNFSASNALSALGSLSQLAGGGLSSLVPSGKKSDPFAQLHFWVEVENEVKAAFAVAQGLQIEIEVTDVKEGGQDHATHKMVKGAKYSNLVLKQGLTTDDYFWRWIDEVRNGKVTRRNITVIVTDAAGENRVSWSFIRAFPVKWVGPQLQADSSAIALQTLEFAHEGLIKNS